MSAAMPISPADFTWWVWMLFSFGAAIVCPIALWIAYELDDRPLIFMVIGLIGLLSGIAALGAGVIGLVRFVKWAWIG
jgi:hypothetical protein